MLITKTNNPFMNKFPKCFHSGSFFSFAIAVLAQFKIYPDPKNAVIMLIKGNKYIKAPMLNFLKSEKGLFIAPK